MRDLQDVSPETAASAGALIRQYGQDAAVIASLRAAEEAANANAEASDFWLSVAFLSEALEPTADPD
jgi:hypothetical protein